jgi:hypothetical protein
VLADRLKAWREAEKAKPSKPAPKRRKPRAKDRSFAAYVKASGA